MTAINGFRVYGYTIAAGQEVTVYVTGDFFRVLNASAAFSVAFDDTAFFEVQAGLAFKLTDGEGFQSVRMRNSSGAAVTVVIALGSGWIEDSRLVFQGDLTTLPASGNGLASAADISVAATTTALIAAANADRTEVIVQNLGGAEMRIGDSAVTAGRGVKLDGGGTLTLTTSAAVYAYNASAGAVDVSVLEIERV